MAERAPRSAARYGVTSSLPAPGNWYAIHAQMKANGRRRRSYRKERLRSKQVQEHVEGRLRQGWSPQQIAGRMKQQEWANRISHEAIYQWIYSKRGDLRQCLAWGRRRRYRRGHNKRHTRSHIPNCRCLKQRSLAANLRQELGHWESDLAVGKQNKAAFVVSVERKSRLLRISKVKDQTARSASRAIIRQLKSLPSRKAARASATIMGTKMFGMKKSTRHWVANPSFANPITAGRREASRTRSD